MIKADYHMHSFYSGDCETPMVSMIESAIAKGLTDICFTEHNDPEFIYVIKGEEGMFDLDTPRYREGFLSCKEQYKNRINLHFGVELGIQPHIYDVLSEYAASFPFEFIIASSHVCKKKDPYYPSYYEGISIKEGIRDYFEEILYNVSHYFDYDIYGHLDYIVRYMPEDRKREYTYNYKDFEDVLEAILKQIIESGKGIELNTSGLTKSIHNTNPCPEIIALYKQFGGEIITVGADAHKSEYVANAFDAGEKILREAGFKHYCTFENRKVRFHDL